MQVSVQLAHLLGSQAHRRGIIKEIETFTGIERHKIAALMKNSPQYVSLEVLGKLCDYLIHKHGYSAGELLGKLFERKPDHFWQMLGRCERIDLCLGVRWAPDWSGKKYMMATDSHLQFEFVSQLSSLAALAAHNKARRDLRSDPQADGSPDRRQTSPLDEQASGVLQAVREAGFHRAEEVVSPENHSQPGDCDGAVPQFVQNLVWAPRRTDPKDKEHKSEGEVKASAEKAYRNYLMESRNKALIATGSVKVNPLVDILFSDTFQAPRWTSEDDVERPTERSSPLVFRYRQEDPHPASCCGGHRLARSAAAEHPGIYYENEDGDWRCCPFVESEKDAAFVFYVYRPHEGRVELACGGFSGRATSCLASALSQIHGQLSEPRYKSPSLEIGLFVIEITLEGEQDESEMYFSAPPSAFNVIPVPAAAIARRVKGGGKSGPNTP